MLRTFLPPVPFRSWPSPLHLPLLTPLLLALSFRITASIESAFSESTADVFSETPEGYPAAFWDTNQDRITDLIVWNDDTVRVFESEGGIKQQHPKLRLSDSLKVQVKSRKIVGVIPGDFNGDMTLDLVIVTVEPSPRSLPATSYRLYVSWGRLMSNGQWQLSPAEAFPKNGDDDGSADIEKQPTVLDYDGNTVPDLLVQKDGKIQRLFVEDLHTESGPLALSGTWRLSDWPELTKLGYELTSQSNAHVDVNFDLIADLCLTMKDKTKKEYFLVVAEHKKFEKERKNLTEPPFGEPKVFGLNATRFNLETDDFDIGQINYVDFNDDHEIDALIPVHLANGTTMIWMLDWGEELHFYDVTPDWQGYQLLPAKGEIPLRIHMGDVDQDGYVDGLAVVTKDNQKRVVLLYNKAKSDDPSADEHARKLVMPKVDSDKDHTASLASKKDVALAAFFDAYDDGFLDILVVSENKNSGKMNVDSFQNNLGIDATWIKAMIYTGFCGTLIGPPCPEEKKDLRELSFPVVGASFKMTTTRGDGKQQKVSTGLLTQLTHFALQMPTTIFGLGRSPNFVDEIMVGLPPVFNRTTREKHTQRFEQTIPNSAVVINPNPLNEPSKWRAYIYVTPSSAMLETGIVLSVVFALLAILVGLLHLKEKREDQKEKLVEMQRFHFDAM